MKKQMKSLNWIVRIKQKFDDELTFKCVVIERWQHEFKRKFEMFNYLKKKSIVFIENCKKSRKRDWMIHFQMNIDRWWKWMIDFDRHVRSRKQRNFRLRQRRQWWVIDILESCAISRIDTSKAIDDVDLFTYKSSFEWCYQLLCVMCVLIDLETMNDKVSIYVQ